MPKHFNTTGPVFPGKHYCIDPMQRIDWEELEHLIDTEKYFVLHAPRQTGKTSTLLAMTDVLNHQGNYKALYVNIEAAQAMRNDVEAGLAIVCETIASSARIYGIEPELEALTDRLLKDRRSGGVLTQQLTDKLK